MCGGKSGLQTALDRGAAILSEHNGTELIMFPKVNIGRREQIDQESTLKRQKLTTNKAFEDVHSAIKSLGWSIKVEQKALEALLC